MTQDFSPIDIIFRAFRTWWLVVILTLVGALVGFWISRAQPPVYEARIAIQFSINYAQTGLLTDVEEDQAFETAVDVFSSSQVLGQVVKSAAQQEIATSLDQLKSASSRERSASTWFIRVRDRDPEKAALLANLWGEQAVTALKEATAHAVKLGGLQRYLSSLESCLASSVGTEPVQSYCSYSNLADIQAKIVETGAAVHSEEIAAQGLMPGMSYNWTEQAVSPSRPVLNNQGKLVLAGALIGFFFAAIFVLAGGADWLIRKSEHD